MLKKTLIIAGIAGSLVTASAFAQSSDISVPDDVNSTECDMSIQPYPLPEACEGADTEKPQRLSRDEKRSIIEAETDAEFDESCAQYSSRVCANLTRQRERFLNKQTLRDAKALLQPNCDGLDEDTCEALETAKTLYKEGANERRDAQKEVKMALKENKDLCQQGNEAACVDISTAIYDAQTTIIDDRVEFACTSLSDTECEVEKDRIIEEVSTKFTLQYACKVENDGDACAQLKTNAAAKKAEKEEEIQSKLAESGLSEEEVTAVTQTLTSARDRVKQRRQRRATQETATEAATAEGAVQSKSTLASNVSIGDNGDVANTETDTAQNVQSQATSSRAARRESRSANRVSRREKRRSRRSADNTATAEATE